MKKEIIDISSFSESVDLECKAAQGRDKKGEVPSSVWETYSAMANTNGGEIYLGIEETFPGVFTSLGIKDIDRVRKSLWDNLHDRSKVNKNILTEKDISVVEVDKKDVIRVTVPRASRHDRPVHLGTNPFGNTYLRRHEGDYKADDEFVRRMIAESIEESRDDRILENFDIEDLDKDTIAAYRNRYSAVKPDSPWLELSTEEFLKVIGAIGKDRSTGKSGLRIAGLLMFGRYETIKEVFPNYMVDYQERPEAKAEARWIDRIVPDGTWSGNLYDYFQKVYRKMTSDLKIPFQLREGVRSDDTTIHETIREALTNCIIHADFTGRVSVLAVKRPDMFGFRNPGLMRISIEQAITGGTSDCRNRIIQSMFRFVGLGDHAGSGIPKIYKNWKEQHWQAPLLYEDLKYEQTLLELRMINFFPEESIKHLESIFGERFKKLPELERIILITAASDGIVFHSKIKEIVSTHPRDISVALAHMVQEHMLIKKGETRASVYHLPGEKPKDIFQSFYEEFVGTAPESDLHDLAGNPPDLIEDPPDLAGNPPDLELVLNSILSSMGYEKLPGKISSDKMRLIIINLCKDRYLSLKELGRILDRDTKSLQDQYLTKMIADSSLELKFPDNKFHPEQAYRSRK